MSAANSKQLLEVLDLYLRDFGQSINDYLVENFVVRGFGEDFGYCVRCQIAHLGGDSAFYVNKIYNFTAVEIDSREQVSDVVKNVHSVFKKHKIKCFPFTE